MSQLYTLFKLTHFDTEADAVHAAHGQTRLDKHMQTKSDYKKQKAITEREYSRMALASPIYLACRCFLVQNYTFPRLFVLDETYTLYTLKNHTRTNL